MQHLQHVLREYALLADGCRAALVGPRGDVAWLCAPGFDDDAVMSGLLGGPGDFSIQPRQRFIWGGAYERGSLVWTGRWLSDDGTVAECTDALAYPGSPDRVVLLRRVTAITGDARLHVVVDPRAGFGQDGLTDLTRDDDDRWTGRCGDLGVRVSGLTDAVHHRAGSGPRRRSGALEGDLLVPAGTSHDLVLEIGAVDVAPVRPDAAWQATRAGWTRAVPTLPGLAADRDADHARAVLRGLTSPAGGMVAAATTSLPERGHQGRRYDYRYAWVRDQALVGIAAAAAGDTTLLDDAVRFVVARLLEHGPRLSPAYLTGGGPVPDERQVDLPGYGGGGVVVGNHVNAQFQLDAFGESLQLLAAAARSDRLDADGWRAAVTAADAVEHLWEQPGAGIWELDDRLWTHSRLSVVAGLKSVAALHPSGASATNWLALADRITAAVSAQALHHDGYWQRAPDDPRVDAALLLPGLRGAVAADDPRSAATFEAVRSGLERDGYIYRFRHDGRDLAESEGAFLFCSFLAALSAHSLGQPVTARMLFERARSACGPPGLFTEEFDTDQRQLRGNLPQAFVHGLLLQCAATLPTC